jgi:cysteinyl-tRNA synthetase
LPGLDAAARVELLVRAEALTRGPAAGTAAVAEDPLVDLVLELRAALRAAKRWDLADRARLELERLGYRVADTPTGSTWERA